MTQECVSPAELLQVLKVLLSDSPKLDSGSQLTDCLTLHRRFISERQQKKLQACLLGPEISSLHLLVIVRALSILQSWLDLA